MTITVDNRYVFGGVTLPARPRPTAGPGVEFTTQGDRLFVRFRRFGTAEYATFLKCKGLPESTTRFDPTDGTHTILTSVRYASLFGVKPNRPPVDRLPLQPALYDDQRFLVNEALDVKRFAVWSGCGNGKTLIGLEFARQVAHLTGRRVLIITVNDIIPEWIGEAARFYGDLLPVERIASRAAMRTWCGSAGSAVGIVNYEKFNPDEQGEIVSECKALGGVILDEASRLRASGGKQKWAVVKSFRGVEYKLALTATPAPNDMMEFASQGSFLEKLRTEADIMWTYFTRDPDTNEWTVKPYARKAFFEFMSSWSIYVNDPKRYGWRKHLPDVPKPEYIRVPIDPTAEQLDAARSVWLSTGKKGEAGRLVATGKASAIQQIALSQIAKGFRYSGTGKTRSVLPIESRKPQVVADIVRSELDRGGRVLVWTEFDAESDILARLLADTTGVEVLTGRVKEKDRPAMIDRFRTGDTRVLVTRAKMLGYGLNLQRCTAMVFSGWDYSFEKVYQAIHRAVRHGQTERVRVYFPGVRELEDDTYDTVFRKQTDFEAGIAEMEENYLRIMRDRGILAA
jgi:superfamily II DNA or RNA helicase